MNGLGLIAASQVNARIVERFGPKRLLRGALVCVVASALVLLVVVLIGGLRRVGAARPMFVIVSSIPFVLPNTTALALADHASVAGTASALLGVIQFMVGAIAAPLVGVAGPDSAVPMGVVMVTLAVGGLVAFQSPAGGSPGGSRDDAGHDLGLLRLRRQPDRPGAGRAAGRAAARPPAGARPRPRGRGAQRPPAVARRLARRWRGGRPAGMGLDELLPDHGGASRSSARSASSPPPARASSSAAAPR